MVKHKNKPKLISKVTHKEIKPIDTDGKYMQDANFQIIPIAKGLKNGEVQCKPKRLPKCPKHMPQLPLLIGGIGIVRAGKTNAFVNMTKEYQAYGSVNRVYIISPTYDSNASLQTIKVRKEDVYRDSKTCIQALQHILSKIQQDADEYEMEQEYKKIYKKWKKLGFIKLDFSEMEVITRENYRKPEDIPWPQPLIFIDDMTHTPLMANSINNELSHLCLHHRHFANVGITILQALQTFKQGMPKVVRHNLGAILLFETMNMKELKDIWEETASSISFETFKQIFFEATKEDHSFLFINRMAKDKNKQFGISFDKVFNIDLLKEKQKILKI